MMSIEACLAKVEGHGSFLESKFHSIPFVGVILVMYMLGSHFGLAYEGAERTCDDYADLHDHVFLHHRLPVWLLRKLREPQSQT